MNPRSIRKIRDRVASSISWDTAKAAGITFEELRGFLSGFHYLDDEALLDLASHLRMKTEELT